MRRPVPWPIVLLLLPVSLAVASGQEAAPGDALAIGDFEVVAGGLQRDSIALAWTAPADASGEAAVSYQARIATTPFSEGFHEGRTIRVSSPGAPGTEERLALGDLAPGTYYVGLQATDLNGAKGPIASVGPLVTSPDSTPPSPAPAVGAIGLTADSGTNLPNVTLQWAPAADAEGAVVHRSRLSRQPEAEVTLWDTLEESSARTLGPLDDGTWYFHLAAFSGGGEVQAPPFRFIVDTEAPDPPTDLRATTDPSNPTQALLRWTPPEEGPRASPLRHEVFVREAGSGTSWADARVEAGPTSEPGSRVEMALQGLRANATLEVAVRPSDAGGNAGLLSRPVRFTLPPDATAPDWNATLSGNVEPAATTLRQDLHFTWPAATDLESPVRYWALLSQDRNRTLGPGDPEMQATELSTSGLEAGGWVLHVRPFSDGGASPQASLPFTVGTATPEDIAAWNQGVAVTLERNGEGNRIAWTLPPGLPAEPAGVQVWVEAGSLRSLAATLRLGSEAFLLRQYLHMGDAAAQASGYAVTLFFAESSELGYLEEPPAELASTELPPRAAAQAEGPWSWVAGLGAPLPVAIGAAAVLLAAVTGIAWAIRRARSGRPSAEPAAEPLDSAWGAPASGGGGWDQL